MRKKILKIWMLALTMMLGLASCSEKDNNSGDTTPVEESSTISVFQDWRSYNVPVFIDAAISGVDEDFTAVLKKQFPTAADIATARLAIVSADHLTADAATLKAIYDDGGIIAVVHPTEAKLQPLMETLGNQHYLPTYSGYGILLYAFTKDFHHYTLLEDDPELDADQHNEERAVSQEDWNDVLKGSNKLENVKDFFSNNSLHYSDNNADFNENHYQIHIAPFVSWVAEQLTAEAKASTRAADQQEELSRYYTEYRTTFPIKLYNRIDKGTLCDEDRLDKNGVCELNYKIFPIYVLSCNPGDAPGDYYIVEGTVNVQNDKLWGPYMQSHGGTNDRVIGYFMRNAKFDYQLRNTDGSKIDGLRFFKDPSPTTTEGSKTYTVGTTWSIGGSLSVGCSEKQGGSGSVGFNFGYSKTNTTSETLSDIRVEQTVDGADVGYKYITQNLNPSDRDYDKLDRDYPALCRGNFIATNTWVWKIPYGKSNVTDGSKTQFQMTVNFTGEWGSYNWWRGASWGYDHTFTNDNGKTLSYTQIIGTPMRQPFGVLALKNAANNTVADIKIWRQDDAADAQPYATIQSSYNVNEVAKAKLVTGKYRLEWNTYDANQGNKLTGTWVYENVEVKQGVTEQDATTEISTINAKEKE